MDSIRRILIRSIDQTGLLTQEDLNQVFAKARMLIDECIELISAICHYPQYYYLDQAIEVLVGIDRNRAIYKKTAPLEEGEFVDHSKETNSEELLCRAIDMGAAIIRGDLVEQQSILLHNNLTRATFSYCTGDWLDLLQDYSSLAEASAAYLAAGEFTEYSQLELVLLFREQSIEAFRPEMVYGACRFVEQRLAAVNYLYEKVLEAYTRIVLKTASISAGSEAQANDSFQNGSFGLMKAIQTYDHCSYVRFSNFANWWIRQAVLYHLKDDANTIHVPINTWQHFNNLERKRSEFEALHGSLSDEEFAELIGYSAEYITKTNSTIRLVEMRSLDKPLTASEDGAQAFNLATNLIDDDLEEQALVDDARTSISAFVTHLTPNERLVVSLNYGVFDQVPDKPTPLGDHEISIERLRQSYVAKKLRQVKNE